MKKSEQQTVLTSETVRQELHRRREAAHDMLEELGPFTVIHHSSEGYKELFEKALERKFPSLMKCAKGGGA